MSPKRMWIIHAARLARSNFSTVLVGYGFEMQALEL